MSLNPETVHEIGDYLRRGDRREWSNYINRKRSSRRYSTQNLYTCVTDDNASKFSLVRTGEYVLDRQSDNWIGGFQQCHVSKALHCERSRLVGNRKSPGSRSKIKGRQARAVSAGLLFILEGQMNVRWVDRGQSHMKSTAEASTVRNIKKKVI